jgi:hypothetical protein
MIIDGKTIVFKSEDSVYKKESTGVKPNTVRLVDPQEKRTIEQLAPENIKIINRDKPMNTFARKITDITFWTFEGHEFVIISWRRGFNI